MTTSPLPRLIVDQTRNASCSRRQFLRQSGWSVPAILAATSGMGGVDLLQASAQASWSPVQNPLRLGFISAASYAPSVDGKLGQVRQSGSNHGTAFATIFNGWDEEKATAFEGTFIKSPTRIAGVQVVKVWDPLPAAAAAMAAGCRIETVCQSPEECCDGVDAVILIDDGTGRQWQYAQHPLKNGIPVFCDKPLAMTAKEARRVAEIAAETGTKFMSASSLRFVPDVVKLREQIAELGEIKLAIATGPGQLVYYGIHALSMVYAVLGGGVQSALHVGSPGRHTVRLRYEHDLETLLVVTEREHFPMGYQLQLFGERGSKTVVPDLQDLYVYLLQAFIDYLRTGNEPFPVSEEVELIAALQAGERSFQTSREVRLAELFE